MLTQLKLTAAIAVLAVAATGAANAHGAAAQAPSKEAWTDVHVGIASNGSVRSMTIAYDSGNPDFDATALAAVARTTFVPDAGVGRASTFDYLVMTKADGSRYSHIVPRLGASTLVSSVRIPPSGNAWLANARICDTHV